MEEAWTHALPRGPGPTAQDIPDDARRLAQRRRGGRWAKVQRGAVGRHRRAGGRAAREAHRRGLEAAPVVPRRRRRPPRGAGERRLRRHLHHLGPDAEPRPRAGGRLHPRRRPRRRRRARARRRPNAPAAGRSCPTSAPTPTPASARAATPRSAEGDPAGMRPGNLGRPRVLSPTSDGTSRCRSPARSSRAGPAPRRRSRARSG